MYLSRKKITRLSRQLFLLSLALLVLSVGGVAAGADSEAPKPRKASYMPLEISLSLNSKYVGQINAKIDPRSNAGMVEKELFISLMKPLIGREAFNTLVGGLESSEDFAKFEAINNAGLNAAFDSFSLSLNVTLKGSDLVTQSLTLTSRSNEPNPDFYTKPSKFAAGVNIAATQVFEQSGGDNQALDPQVALDGLINIGGFEGVTIEGGARYSGQSKEPWKRTPVLASKDFFSSAVRVTGGEITPRTNGFQAAQRMLGLGFFRSYSNIRPFQTVRPTGRTEFDLDEDSVVEVYVNEILVDTMDLPAGSYSLNDFPVTNRSNDVRLEILSRTGDRETLNFGVYGGSELLAPGLSDFGFFLGNQQAAEFDYSGGLAATGYYRRGITGKLSLGATLQATEMAQQLGLVSTFGSRLGLIELEAATSRNTRDDAIGAAYRLNYQNTFSAFSADDLRISANAEYRTDRFQHAFEDSELSPVKWVSAVQATWRGNNGFSGTLGLLASERRGAQAGKAHSVNLSLSKSFGNLQLGASFNLSESVGRGATERFNITLGYRPGGNFSSTAQYSSTDNTTSINLRNRSKQIVGGLNLAAQFQDGERGNQARLNGTYNHNRFESAVQHTYKTGDRGNRESIGTTQVRLSSFVGYSGGDFGIGRPVRSGFVLANKHRSLKGSRVDIKNGKQFVARPSFLGAAVIPLTRPYTVNNFDIVVDPLPLGYDIGEGSITVFPGHGSSFNVPIGSDASRTAMGYLYNSNGPMALVGGTVSPLGNMKDKEKWQRPMFTNRAGRFVADRLKAGSYEIIVDGKSIAEFKISKKSEGLIKLGKLGNTEND